MDNFQIINDCEEVSKKIKSIRLKTKALQASRAHAVKEIQQKTGLPVWRIREFIDNDPDHIKLTEWQNSILTPWYNRRINASSKRVVNSKTNENNLTNASQNNTQSTPISSASISSSSSSLASSATKRNSEEVSDDSDIIFDSNSEITQWANKKIKKEISSDDEDFSLTQEQASLLNNLEKSAFKNSLRNVNSNNINKIKENILTSKSISNNDTVDANEALNLLKSN
jgi:hypothetical protein